MRSAARAQRSSAPPFRQIDQMRAARSATAGQFFGSDLRSIRLTAEGDAKRGMRDLGAVPSSLRLFSRQRRFFHDEFAEDFLKQILALFERPLREQHIASAFQPQNDA